MALRARLDDLPVDDSARPRPEPFDFGELSAMRRDLRAACRRMPGDGAHADDLVQEAFLRAVAHADRLDRRTSLVPWLATVARRRSIDEFRARRLVEPRAVTPEPAITPSHQSDPLDHVLRQEAVDRVRAALDELTPRERQLLLRQVAHGLSLSELATEEATTVASVRSVLARARAKLRASVERAGPLGVAPFSGPVATLRRRLQHWVGRVESRTPYVAGATAQLGEAVAAVVAAVALLLNGTAGPAVPGAPPALLASGLTAVPAPARPGEAVPGAPANATAPPAASVPPAATPATTTTTTPATTATTDGAPLGGGGPAPDWDKVPTLPVDEYDQPEQMRISTFSTSSDRRIVFATGMNVRSEDVVLRSEDNGRTWRRLPIPRAAKELLVPPTYPTEPTLFLVNEASLLRSDDDGGHFYPVAPVRGGVAFAPDYPVSKRVLVAGNPILEYRAGPAPGTVRPLLATPPSVDVGSIAVGWDDGGGATVLVGGTSANSESVLRSAVFACTRTVCTEHAALPGTHRAPLLHRSTSAPGAVFAWKHHRVLRSGDEGRTFTPAALPAHNLNAFVDGAPGEVFAVGQSIDSSPGVHRSTDRGRSWRPMGAGTVFSKGARAIVRLSSGRLLAAALTNLGMYCSDDDGRSWSRRCA